MRVLKFGGTSVADAGRIARVAAVVSESAARERTVVVVSALAGVTDALADAAAAAAGGEECRERADSLERRHRECLDAVAPRGDATARRALDGRIVELRRLLASTTSRRRCAARDRDSILATGERLSAALVAAALRAAGVAAEAVDAAELVRTDSRFGEARVDAIATNALVRRRLGGAGDGPAPVVTGFVGADAAGRTTTLGRGGSDYSASLLAAALRASVVEIWTDVDGVLSAPPRLFAGARTVPELSYEEAAELASLGAKVLHRDTMRPVAALGIPIAVRNTFAPSGGATLISSAPAASAPGPAAVAAVENVERRPGLAIVALVGHGLGRGPALGGSARSALAAGCVPFVAARRASSPHSFSALVERRDVPAALAALHGRVVPRAAAGAR